MRRNIVGGGRVDAKDQVSCTAPTHPPTPSTHTQTHIHTTGQHSTHLGILRQVNVCKNSHDRNLQIVVRVGVFEAFQTHQGHRLVENEAFQGVLLEGLCKCECEGEGGKVWFGEMVRI